MHRGGGGFGSSDLFDLPSPYGNSFGSKGLPKNSYISNNNYQNKLTHSGSGFLMNALLSGNGMHSGYLWYKSQIWTQEKDQNWRKTTQAPYFENKIPEEDKILPASAVIGEFCFFLHCQLRFWLIQNRSCNSIRFGFITSSQCPTWKASHALR